MATRNNGDDGVKVSGTSKADVIYNDGSQVTINAGSGNDSICNDYYGANVSISAGSGYDTIENYGSQVTIIAGSGNDYIINSNDDDNGGTNVTINAGAGDDIITSYGDNVLIDGGAGDDTIESEGDRVTVSGGTGDDLIKVEKKYDTYDYYDDEPYYGEEYDGRTFKYNAGDGDDTIEGFSKKDKLIIGDGTATYSEKYLGEDILVTVGDGSILLKGAAVNLGLDDSKNSTLKFNGGTRTADASERTKAIKITGNIFDNVMIGGAGKDTLNGGAGDDTLTGGKGADVFVYTGGHDVIRDYTTSDRISLDAALVYENYYTEDNDVILEFGDGNSLRILNGLNKSITNIAGSNSTVNVYNDEFQSNKGKTAVTLGSWLEEFNAEDYPKLVTIDASKAYEVVIVANELSNKIIGTGGEDKIYGGEGKDTIYGGDDYDIIYGDAGNDKLYGEGGDDYLSGGAGNDLLSGGAGNDTLLGGSGRDTLTGGTGNDLFIFSSGEDIITDYASGEKISVEADFENDLTRIELRNSDSILIFGNDRLTVQNTRGKKLNVTDSTGKSFSVLAGGTILTDDNKAKAALTSDIEIADASARTKAIKITGNANANSILGGAGNDTLFGGAGDDSLWGNGGADKLIYEAGSGNDVIFGFADDDTLTLDGLEFTSSYSSKNKTVTLNFNDGSVMFKEFTASTFHIDSSTYKIVSGKFQKQ